MRHILILTFILFLQADLTAQISTYASFFGDDALVAANIDFRDEKPGILHYSFRWGVGFWSDWGGATSLSIPHHITLLIGKEHALETGVSAAFRPDFRPRYRAHSIIGYRYQKRIHGLIVRAYIDPLAHNSFHYKFGVAVGHSF